MSSTAGASHLANGSINLLALRDYYRQQLCTLLDAQPAKKALVLDKTLSGPLGLVAEVELLRQHGVEQIYHLLPGELSTPVQHIIYLVRPCITLMKYIADHILSHKHDNIKRTYTIYFVSRKTMLCEKQLIDSGVRGDVTLGELYMELIPFEDDVLSMEINTVFKECFLDGDISNLFCIARSIMKLQSIFGLIPVVKGKGHNSLRVFHLLQRLRRESGPTMYGPPVPEIAELILIDRNVDMVTTMMTQLTYEGLIDELFGIKNSYIDVSAELVGAKTEGPKKLLLNNNDALLKETRDLNFRVLGPLLHKKAEFIKDTYSERHSATTVNEMHSFMQKFKTAHAEHSLLQTHINLAEKISNTTKSKVFDRRLDIEKQMCEGVEVEACEEYVDACIAKQEPIISVYRLLCLMSLTIGIKPKKYEYLKREVIHAYGYEQMFTLNNFEKLGLFTPVAKRNWNVIRKSLRLHVPNVDLLNPADIAYTFNGYAPLSVRLIESASKPGWKRMDEILTQLPGKTFEFRQEQFVGSSSNHVPVNLLEKVTVAPSAVGTPATGTKSSTTKPTPEAKEAAPSSVSGRKKPLTLVFFIGGVTFTEISALRYLSQRDDHDREYIVATTKLINGNTLIESVKEEVVNKLKKSGLPGK